MDNDLTIWNSLNDQWKDLIIKNIHIQENLDKLPEFSFWNGTENNYEKIGATTSEDKKYGAPLRFPAKIDIYSTRLNSLDSLTNTRGLQEFYMGETSIEDITPICGNSLMTKLCCYNSPIKQIDSLNQLTHLKRLCLSRTMVIDINPLEGLLDLERLALYKTDIYDLRPLAKLTKLKKLNINFTKVKDISPLFGLSNLEELHCYQTDIETEQLAQFKSKCPNCLVINEYEQSESEYDDFQ